MKSLCEARAQWARGDELDKVLDQISGDIVQAVQALKESKPEPTSTLLGELQGLLASLEALHSYCFNTASQALGYPFTRAERQVRDVISFLYPEAAASFPSPQAAKTITISAKERHIDIETFQLGPHRMPRVFNGLWQLSSPAWGSASAESQETALAELVELGLSTAGKWDLAVVPVFFGRVDCDESFVTHIRNLDDSATTSDRSFSVDKSGNYLLTEPPKIWLIITATPS